MSSSTKSRADVCTSALTRLVLKLYQRDIFGVHVINLEATNTTSLRRLNSYYEHVDDNYVNPQVAARAGNMPQHIQILLTQVIDNEGCQAAGYLNVYKVGRTMTDLVSRLDPIFYHVAAARVCHGEAQHGGGHQQAHPVT